MAAGNVYHLALGTFSAESIIAPLLGSCRPRRAVVRAGVRAASALAGSKLLQFRRPPVSTSESEVGDLLERDGGTEVDHERVAPALRYSSGPSVILDSSDEPVLDPLART